MFRSTRYLFLASMAAAVAMAAVACGSAEPTATPTVRPTTPTPTAGAGTTPVAATPTPAGRDMEAYFRGKTINLVVGFTPGGGYDTTTRIFALTAPKYFPGQPRFIVTNLPGSGGLRAAQTVSRGDANGLTTTPLATRFVAQGVVGPVEGFDAQNTIYVGSPTAGPRTQAFYMKREIATTWDAVRALGRVMRTGTSSAGGDLIGPQLAEFLGEPVRVIFGYGGTAEVLAALDRGELDGTTRGNPEYVLPLYPEWVDEKFLVPVFWWRSPVTPEWLAALNAPAPPHIFDVLTVTAEQRAVFELADSIEQQTRMFILHPDTPADIAAQWRASFRQIVEDPDFQQRMEAAELPAGYTDPQTMLDGLRVAETFSEDARNLFKTLYGLE